MNLKDAVRIYDECAIKVTPKWDASECSHCRLAESVTNGFYEGEYYCDLLHEIANLLKEVK